MTVPAGPYFMSHPLSQRRAGRSQTRLSSRDEEREPSCLVISTSQERRRTMVAAAELAGWTALGAPDVAKADAFADRLSFGLVVADLVGAELPDRTICAALFAKLRDALIVVCGSGSRPDEEIWARQLGVWLYLPACGGPPDLGSVCGEARQIASPPHSRHG